MKTELRSFNEAEHPRDGKGRFTFKNKETVRQQREKAVAKLRKKVGDYKNSSSGINAHLNSRSIKKMTSDKALRKSLENGFTEEQHFETVRRSPVLFKKAKLVSVQKDRDDKQNILSIKRFNTEFKLKSGRKANAYFTVKETLQNGHTLYSVELKK